eukprot:1190310-Prorocentrum_minimum.AAC.1
MRIYEGFTRGLRGVYEGFTRVSVPGGEEDAWGQGAGEEAAPLQWCQKRRGPRQGWSTGRKAPRWAAGRTGLPRPICHVLAFLGWLGDPGATLCGGPPLTWGGRLLVEARTEGRKEGSRGRKGESGWWGGACVGRNCKGGRAAARGLAAKRPPEEGGY